MSFHVKPDFTAANLSSIVGSDVQFAKSVMVVTSAGYFDASPIVQAILDSARVVESKASLFNVGYRKLVAKGTIDAELMNHIKLHFKYFPEGEVQVKDSRKYEGSLVVKTELTEDTIIFTIQADYAPKA